MSDDTATTDTDDSEQATHTQHESGTAGESDMQAKMARYAQWAAFTLLCLVALIATVRLYFAASATIDTFVTRRYRPLFMAGFNLAVLLSCGIGLSALLRRLT